MSIKYIINILYKALNFIRQLFFGIIINNDSTVAALLRKKIYKTSCMIDTNVYIKNSKNIISGNNSCIYHSSYILNTHGKFIIGNNSHLGAFCYVNVYHGNVIVGDNVAIGPGTKIISYSNHYKYGGKVTDEKIIKDVIIKNNVFIGANCTILPGSIINENTIIGAGSVIRGELEANSIYAGIPGKKIKSGWYK